VTWTAVPWDRYQTEMKGVNTGVGEDVAVGRFTVSRLVFKLEAKSVSTSVRWEKGRRTHAL